MNIEDNSSERAERSASIRSDAERSLELESIRTRTRKTLLKALGGAKEVALLDIPRHNNAGDTLIWLGERQYLADLNVRIVYESDRLSVDSATLRDLPPDVPLLLHGGGNLGDLYPAHEKFRREMIRNHRDRRIVVLSQSVLYADERELQKSMQIYGDHPDLLFLIRDQESLSRFRKAFDGLDSEFCFDMALGFRPNRNIEASNTPFATAVIRDDKETGVSLSGLADHPDIDFGDWRHGRVAAVLWLGVYAHGRLARQLTGPQTSSALRAMIRVSNRLVYIFIRNTNLRTIERSMSRAGIVVTNRLHGHIASVLYGKQHIVIDNSYGKISSVYREYTSRVSNAAFVRDESEVREVLRRWKNAH